MKKKVLIVEDHPDMQELLKIQVEQFGFKEIDTVKDGLQATAYLEKHGEEVSLIVAAWEQSRDMRRTLGEGTLEMARETNPDVHIVLLTTNPRPEFMAYLKSIGAD